MKCISRISVWSHGLMAGSLLLSLHALGVEKIWVGPQDGEWGEASNWTPSGIPANGDDAVFNAGGSVTISDNYTVRQIRVPGTADAVLTIADTKTLTVANAGGTGLQAIKANLTINGPGLLALSTSAASATDVNHLDNGAESPCILTINARIVAVGGGNNTGFETWVATGIKGGTVVLGNANNAFTYNFNAGNSHTVVADTLTTIGNPSSIGDCAAFLPARGSILKYTGGATTTDRQFLLSGGDATFGYGGGIHHDGSGILTWSGNIQNNNNNTQTLTLLGDTAYEARITGNIANGQGTLGIIKNGTGTWTLAGANNTFTGPIALNAGTLGLDSATAAGAASQIIISDGATLAINPSSADTFSLIVPTIIALGRGTDIIVAEAQTSSTVTFKGITAPGIAITAPATIGTGNNRILINGLTDGPVGPWLSLNGGPATYSAVNGLTPLALTTANIATKGSTIAGTVDSTAVTIDTAATGDPIALTDTPTTLYSLTQAVTDDDATVDTAGNILMATEIAMIPTAAALTIGIAPKDGTLLPQLQTVAVVPPPPSISAVPGVTAQPLIWYDPSDANNATVQLNTFVTGLANKGTGGTGMDAAIVARSNFRPPLYATGATSHSTLPMLRHTTNNQGLESLAKTGISGNAPRTLIAVMSRDNSMIVSIGSSASRQAFETFLNGGTSLRFGAYSDDIDITPAAVVGTPIVMSMIHNGTSFQGWANGVAAINNAPRTTTLSTADTPLCLGHRNGTSADSYRGQIGEVMLFDCALTDAEREAVETYLMTKWQQPKTASTQSAPLTLRNDSTAAPLTVNAAITEPVGSSVPLVKAGEGDVILAGGATLSGPTLIEAGALTVATPVDTTDILSGIIAGEGKLVMDGPGALHLPFTAASQYTGGTDIRSGTVLIGNSRSLGTGAITIEDGGTLDLGGAQTENSIILNNRVTLSGAGADGEGALVNNGAVQQRNAFQNTTVTLAADATIGGTLPPSTRWDFAAGTILDLNNHTLSKKGVSDFRISPAIVTNAPDSAIGPAFHIQQGVIGVESSTRLYPEDDQRQIAIDGGARFGLYAMQNPVKWAIVPADGAEIWTYGGNVTNQNVLTADITLPTGGALHLTTSGDYTKNLAGQLKGEGGLTARGSNLNSFNLLSNPNNTFTGPVNVTTTVLSLLYAGSLPDSANLMLAGNSAVRIYPNVDRWPLGSVTALAQSSAFDASNKALQIDVGAGGSENIPDSIGTGFLGTLDKYGAGSVAYDGNITMTANIRSFAGTIILTNDNTTLDFARAGFYLADSSGADCGLIVGGNAILKNEERGYNYNMGNAALHVGTHATSKTVVELKDNGRIEAKPSFGGLDAGDTNTVAAVYQTGGTFLSFAGRSNDGRIGRYGYAYYQLDDGDLTMKGYLQFGWANNGVAAGILRQTGGTFAFNGQRDALPADNTVGESYGGSISLSRGGAGIFQLEGGTFQHYGELRMLDNSDNSGTGGTAIMTVTGTADAMSSSQVQMGDRANGVAILNLNGGKLTTTYVRRMDRSGTRAAVNFNGGTLCVTNSTGNAKLFAQDNNAPISAYVHANGGTIEIGEGVVRSVDIPLQGPQGLSVFSIPVTAGGSGYVAPPQIVISGGGGSNATAFAHINRATGAVTGIEITNPGDGYTSAPTATIPFRSGGGSGATLGRVNLSSGGKGGLTKTGAGALILNAPNTYAGPTRVEDGALVLGHPQALPTGTEIIIGDGTLNLGGHTVTNLSVTITGTGGIINGKVVTASAVKTGPGTATLSAEIEFAAISLGEITPGLWEGRVKGVSGAYFDLTTPNPKTSIQLTTRAGNINPTVANTSGNIIPGTDATVASFWDGNHSMCIYSGYLWNRTATNVVWTWRTIFDDNISLSIDGILLRNHLNTATYTKHTLTPGPHAIEIRFGDNTGNVGAASGPGGLSYDPFGRGSTSEMSNYILLVDPGDGSLLTATLGEWAQPDTAIRVEGGTLQLQAAAQPGLWESHIQGSSGAYWYPDMPNPMDSVQFTTRAGNIPVGGNNTAPRSEFWGSNNNMWIYTGYIWNDSSTPSTWGWRFVFDDNVSLKLNGVLVRDNKHGDGVQYATATLNPGWNAIDVRFGDGTGSVGPASGASGLMYNRLNPESTDVNTYSVLADSGNGAFLVTSLATSDLLSGLTFDVSSNATLDLGGLDRAGLTITGDGTVINGTFGTDSVISPAGTNHVGTLSVNGIGSLNGMTYLVTVHDYEPGAYANTPGLYEGMVSGGWNPWAPNPNTSVQFTTRAGNHPGPAVPNTSGNIIPGTEATVGSFWSGNQRTWIYTGYVWNNAATDATWTWRFTFDDEVALWLDGKLIRHIPLGLGVQYVDTTLTPGPHAIEIRFGDGTGNVGPASGLGGITCDFQGRGATNLEYYAVLTDSGNGELFTLTANIDPGRINDVITSATPLDLTGLTIKPSDSDSISPPGNNYVIATAPEFIGTPTVVDFTGKKWKTLRKGTELWLTTQGGTILLLR